MAEFKITTEEARDLTRIEFFGTITGTTVIDAVKTLYGSKVTTKVLWDFSNCDVSVLPSADFSQFVEIGKNYAHRRKNGKSALVCPDDLAFGLGRMITSIAVFNNYPVQSSTFRIAEEALAWLDT